MYIYIVYVQLYGTCDHIIVFITSFKSFSIAVLQDVSKQKEKHPHT